jgi:creatinine amidohydrolase
MSIYTLENLSWPEFNELARERTIIFIPLSPVEEHGPHLPLGTDFFSARDIAERAAGIVSAKDGSIQAVLAPTIPLGCAEITADFPGTISLRGKTLVRVIVDICSSLARHGFRYILISNHHLDPVHVKAILTAIEEVSASYTLHVIESASRIVYSGLATEEAAQGQAMGLDMRRELHADVKETSFIKYRYSDLIKQNVSQLPPVLIEVEEGFRKGCTTFKEMGADQGYIGTPAMAREEYGRLHLEEWARLTAELALKLIEGEKLPEMSQRMKRFLDSSVILD